MLWPHSETILTLELRVRLSDSVCRYIIIICYVTLGKKNFLPPCQLSLGFGFLFRVKCPPCVLAVLL